VSGRQLSFCGQVSSSGRSVGFPWKERIYSAAGTCVWVVVHGQYVRSRISVARASPICRSLLAQVMSWKNGTERPSMQPVSNNDRYLHGAVDECCFDLIWSSMFCDEAIGLNGTSFLFFSAIRSSILSYPINRIGSDGEEFQYKYTCNFGSC
jgi:hypothetical protein